MKEKCHASDRALQETKKEELAASEKRLEAETTLTNATNELFVLLERNHEATKTKEKLFYGLVDLHVLSDTDTTSLLELVLFCADCWLKQNKLWIYIISRCVFVVVYFYTCRPRAPVVCV